jgi:hypothetical protein
MTGGVAREDREIDRVRELKKCPTKFYLAIVFLERSEE